MTVYGAWTKELDEAYGVLAAGIEHFGGTTEPSNRKERRERERAFERALKRMPPRLRRVMVANVHAELQAERETEYITTRQRVADLRSRLAELEREKVA